VKIATWNVNSIRIRVDAAVAWLKEAQPDVVALQELKCTDDQFPKEPFEALGYNCAVHGQKTYNGVAILSKRPLEDVTPRLPGGDGDDHARYLEAIVPGEKGVVRVASIYAPNGNPIGTEKFAYKLDWLERLHARAKDLLKLEEPAALMGRPVFRFMWLLFRTAEAAHLQRRCSLVVPQRRRQVALTGNKPDFHATELRQTVGLRNILPPQFFGSW